MTRRPVWYEVIWLHLGTGETMRSGQMTKDEAEKCLQHPGWHKNACPTMRRGAKWKVSGRRARKVRTFADAGISGRSMMPRDAVFACVTDSGSLLMRAERI
jgi:hypothetical protein